MHVMKDKLGWSMKIVYIVLWSSSMVASGKIDRTRKIPTIVDIWNNLGRKKFSDTESVLQTISS